MAKGDHIYVWRSGYTHHGIDCGDGTVIHYTGEPSSKSNAEIARTSFKDFSQGNIVYVEPYEGEVYSASEVLKRAKSRLKEKSYNLVFNNCEHFAAWCKTGRERSQQVHNAVNAASKIGAVAAVLSRFIP